MLIPPSCSESLPRRFVYSLALVSHTPRRESSQIEAPDSSSREASADLAEKFTPSSDDPGIAAGRLHSFRHYFCSMSADNEVPEQMLMAWLGHRDSEMIRHYYHMRQDEARKQMAKIPFLGQLPKDAKEP